MKLPSWFIALEMFTMLVMKGGCNETTHYLSTRGICCELCPAGSRKVMDCEFDTTSTFCTSCEPGQDYTDEPNSSNECKECTVCNANFVDTVSRCTTMQDTRCRCRDGFQRAAPSDPCTEARGDAESAMDASSGVSRGGEEDVDSLA
ncbi:unnamed protein product, partial [Lampetra fluviatilis]